MRRPIIAVLVVFALVACGGSPPSKSEQESQPTTVAAPNAASTITEAPQPTTAPPPTEAPTTIAVEPGKSRSLPLSAGTEVRTTTWSITVTKVTRGKEALAAIVKDNKFNKKPTEGSEYLLADIKVVNIGTEQKPQDPSFGVDIRVTGERNLLYGRTAIVPLKQLEGQLLPKGEAEGQIVFEVPLDEKNLMLRIGETLSFDEGAYRFVAIDEGATVTPPADLPSATDAGVSKDAPAKVGDAVTTDSYQATILEVVRGADAAAKIKEANQFNSPAPAGQEYILIKARVRALDTQTPDSTLGIDKTLFKLTGEKNVVYDLPLAVAPEPNLDAIAFPGGEVEGWIVLGVAEGEQKLVAIVAPLISFSDSETRYITLP